ncbi:unnamed protein product [Clonostachys solani]|uniref:C2H2-type domain-containing protein n=1 Tax=Clonostachys solani TaxID=160281 RepID=A0A9N9ZE07_9HYPO|nr:unnamed protein product [Clonostachys solani]
MDETNGYPPFEDQEPLISSMLRSKMGTSSDSARIFIPDRKSFNTSSIAYVAYKWVKIPISCGTCDQSFESFDELQLHRNHTHGAPEGTNPLPDA